MDHILRHEPLEVSNPRRYPKQLAKAIDEGVLAAIDAWLDERS